MSESTTVPMTDITIGGFNPREVDTESGAFGELMTSIEKHGILQPILLRKAPKPEPGERPLQVVAGHRRYLAAEALQMEEVPALIVELGDGEAKIAALTENVQREQMSPIEEARALKDLRKGFGLTQEEAADVLGKSIRWARDRERLLRLPDQVLNRVATGGIPLEAAQNLEPIAKVAPEVAELMTAPIREEDGQPVYRRLLETNEIERAIRQVAKEAGIIPVYSHGGGYLSLSEVPKTDEIDEAVEAAGGTPWNADHRISGLTFDTDSIDAARAYGCLLELDGSSLAYVTDDEWMTDRIVQLLETAGKERAKEREERAEEASERDQQKAEFEKRRAEQEQLVEIGTRDDKALYDAMGDTLSNRTATVHLDGVKALVAALIDNGMYGDSDELLEAALGHHDDRFIWDPESEERKAAVKAAGLPEEAAPTDAFLAELDKATAVDDVLMIGMRLIALDNVSARATARNRNYTGGLPASEILGIDMNVTLDEWLMASKFTPQGTRDLLERRRATRAELEAQAAEAAIEADAEKGDAE